MPTYEYECDACGHKFEKFQSMTAKTLRKCPACGKPKLQRLMGAGAGIIFKGSGFYETDYKRKSPPKSENSDGASKGESASTDSSKSEKGSSDSSSKKD